MSLGIHLALTKELKNKNKLLHLLNHNTVVMSLHPMKKLIFEYASKILFLDNYGLLAKSPIL